MHHPLSTRFSCVIAGAFAALGLYTQLAPCISTTSGTVGGHASARVPSVSEYLGIPYAQPPVGELRFLPPVAYTGSGFVNGSNYGFTCPKKIKDSLTATPSNHPEVAANYTPAGTYIINTFSQLGDAPRQNEDCLTLNVWTPAGTFAGAKKAVLVWIYGGGFNNGATNQPLYDGSLIAADEEVVVVSLNYRVNIFGFPGTPTNPNNLGLLDQRLAVEWVHTNIENFGGDPDRITIFGQSAGGASVDYYSYAWAQDPLIAGTIMMSGTVEALPILAPEVAAASWFNVTSSLGCGNATSDHNEVLKCMQDPTLTKEEIQEIAHTKPFFPTVDNTTVFSLAAYKSGNLTPAAVPAVIGTVSNEAGIFDAEVPLGGMPIQPSVAAFNNASFFCPGWRRADKSEAAGNPTWRYMYDPVWTNMQLRVNKPEAGAFHITDVYSVFGVTPTCDGCMPMEPAQRALSRYMRKAFAAFAKDPEEGLEDFGWGEWEGKMWVALGKGNMVGAEMEDASAWRCV